MRVTLLGMGGMGRALGSRLLDTGHELTVWNRTAGRAGELTERGAIEAPGVAEAVEGSDAVLSVLTDDAAVRAVLLDGGSPSVPEPATVVDCSTVAPATTRALAAAYGDRFGACPILAAPAALAAGEAAIVTAGPPALLDRLGPLWTSLSGSVRRVGDDPALALVVKLIANYFLLSGIAVVAEAAVTGAAAGLSDEVLIDLFGAVAAPNLRNRVADVVSGDHDGWFPTPMGAKDAHLMVDLARSVGVGLPIASLVAARYDEAAAAGFDRLDIAGVVELLRRR